MTVREPERPDGGDDLEAMFDAGRAVSERADAGRALDWRRVWRTVHVRRRRRVVGLVALAAVVAAGATLAAVRWLPGAGDGGWRTAGGGRPVEEPMAAGDVENDAAGVEEYRLLRPAPRVQVVAERSARVEFRSATEAVLDAGAIWVHVAPAAGPVDFSVVTPDARVSVKGTRFAVTVEPGPRTVVAVADGLVRLESGGMELSLPGGSEWSSGAPAPARLAEARREAIAAFFPAAAGEAPRCASSSSFAAVPDMPAGPAAADGPAGDPPPATGDQPPTVVEVVAAGDGERDGDGGAAAADPERLYREAEVLLAQGRLEEAAGLLERVAELAAGTPLGGTALMDLAARRLRLGSPDRAAAAYRRYLAEQPRGPLRGDARIALCRIALEAERWAEMRACYAAYLEEEPHGPYAAEARQGMREEEAR